MTPSLLALLRRVDTPTVCNAIEVAQGRRGFDRFTRDTLLASSPDAPAMVGRARTARIAAKVPSTEDVDTVRARRMAYYEYMASAEGPAVVVIEDEDGPEAVGAFWGELNTTVHKAFGLEGVVTNGVMRDLGDMAPGFPVVAGRIGPSHAFVRVTAFDTPVSLFGLTVSPGEWVHADRHGALVIPEEVLPTLEAAILKAQACERIVLDAAARPGFGFEDFRSAWAEFENNRT